jgi:hypothetical protein
VVSSAPGYDDTAADTARKWRFYPARTAGGPVASTVYAVLGFPEPSLPPTDDGSRAQSRGEG